MGRSPQRYAAVSVFSGCGGLDLGAERSGRARVVWAVDNEHWAVETYRRNLGRHIVEGDVAETAVPDVPCDILLAGPPCQDYSTLPVRCPGLVAEWARERDVGSACGVRRRRRRAGSAGRGMGAGRAPVPSQWLTASCERPSALVDAPAAATCPPAAPATAPAAAG